MLYGRQGTFAERSAAIREAKDKGVEIEMPVTYDKATILTSLQANDEKINVPAQDATVEVATTRDEDTLMTGSTITLKDEVVGKEVDDNELADTIFAQLGQNDFTPVTAETKVTQPKLTKADLEDKYALLGTYSTEYAKSDFGRRYNIWKMADVINGVKIEPGETWSINEEAGPRSYSRGWKAAPGIADGKYQDEPGGGICQTSSTLYNAVLRAEVEIVDRSHHSWPLNYVPGGLDATISTGAPDFKIRNNYDIPIYIIANCDGQNRTIEISIYGPKFEDGLTRDFTSKEVGGSPAGEQIIEDPTLPEGTRIVERSSHPRRVFDVYKHWYDENGKEVKVEKYSTELSLIHISSARFVLQTKQRGYGRFLLCPSAIRFSGFARGPRFCRNASLCSFRSFFHYYTSRSHDCQIKSYDFLNISNAKKAAVSGGSLRIFPRPIRPDYQGPNRCWQNIPYD